MSVQHVRKWCREVKNELCEGVCLHPDNARPHAADATNELIAKFGWIIVKHPPYSPDLAPSDYHLFPDGGIGGDTHFGDREELEEAVLRYLRGLACKNRIQKCIDLSGDYVAK
ncbi:histone-lysine N-methyltransferase SETMAR-like [Belonocnema kinseyi]|uniref:histone-lysine N-methyltransferase SETMAR-like n=1 Tax=Belonocnema kinseyi TaxID=2817044 RepID=UPI00143DCD2C|nr:histone-lysine N-methyltransferase SETMAR-like [Belonocnema kinseyi]